MSKLLIFKILNLIHLKLFGHDPSPKMKEFFRLSTWSLLGITISSSVLFLINVLAGRKLGPGDYGKYNFIFILAGLISLAVLYGLDSASIKYITVSKSQDEKDKYASSSFWAVFFAAILIAIAGFSFSKEIASFFGIDKRIIFFSILVAFFLSIKGILDGIGRGFGFFRFQSYAKITESVTAGFFFAVFFYIIKLDSYVYYVLSLIIGTLLFCLLFFARIRKFITPFDFDSLKKMTLYSRSIFALSAMTLIMGSIDRVFIGKFIGQAELGLYSAYLVATAVWIGQVVLIIDNVFFPIINSIEDKRPVLKKIDRLFMLLFFPVTAVIILFSFTILLFFGHQYQINWYYIIVFSLAGFLQVMSSLYRSIIQSVRGSLPSYKGMLFIIMLFQFFVFGLFYEELIFSLNYIVLAYGIINLLFFFVTRINSGYALRRNLIV